VSEQDQKPSAASADTKPNRTILWVVLAVLAAIALGAGITYLLQSIRTRPEVVPNVLRMTQPAAASEITAAGFDVGTVSKLATSQVGVGLVVTQNPLADATAPKGSGVDLSIAVAPVDASTPDLVGMTGDAATKLLADHLFLPRTYRQYSATVPTGSVAAQLPTPGTPTQTGNQIYISVSLGKGKGNTVPEIVGMSQAQAATELQRAGITPIWNFTNINPAALPVGAVVDQAPEPGTVIPTDEVIVAAVAIRQ
jgi:eukaryotic-like serine/threonine-protein kinase